MTGTSLGGGFDCAQPDFGRRLQLLARRRRLSSTASGSSRATTWSTNAARRSGTTCPSGWRTPRAGRTCAATCTSSSAATRQLSAQGRVPLPAVLDRLAGFPRARLLRHLGDLVPEPAAGRDPAMYATRDTPDAAHVPGRRQRVAEQGLPAGPRHPPVGRRRAALLPPLGRRPAGRVRRRLGHRGPDLALHADRRRLKCAAHVGKLSLRGVECSTLTPRADNNIPVIIS